MPLGDIISCTVILDGGPTPGKADLIGRLLRILADAGHVPHAEVPAVLAAVLRRERLGSTGIGRGLAVPHARHDAVGRPVGILAVCRPPVEFDAVDGDPVDIVALILSPPDPPGRHLGGSGGDRRDWSAGLPTTSSAGGCGGPGRRRSYTRSCLGRAA